MWAAPECGCSALSVSTLLAKCCIPNASRCSPSLLAFTLPSISPQPHLSRQDPAASPQAPCSLCLSCPPPATTTEPQSPEKMRTLWKSRSQIPPRHQLPIPMPAVPVGTVPTAGTCSLTHCSLPEPQCQGDGRAHPGTIGSACIQGAALCAAVWLGNIDSAQPGPKPSCVSTFDFSIPILSLSSFHTPTCVRMPV